MDASSTSTLAAAYLKSFTVTCDTVLIDCACGALGLADVAAIMPDAGNTTKLLTSSLCYYRNSDSPFRKRKIKGEK
jgi:hypothetical protein